MHTYLLIYCCELLVDLCGKLLVLSHRKNLPNHKIKYRIYLYAYISKMQHLWIYLNQLSDCKRVC